MPKSQDLRLCASTYLRDTAACLWQQQTMSMILTVCVLMWMEHMSSQSIYINVNNNAIVDYWVLTYAVNFHGQTSFGLIFRDNLGLGGLIRVFCVFLKLVLTVWTDAIFIFQITIKISVLGHGTCVCVCVCFFFLMKSKTGEHYFDLTFFFSYKTLNGTHEKCQVNSAQVFRRTHSFPKDIKTRFMTPGEKYKKAGDCRTL